MIAIVTRSDNEEAGGRAALVDQVVPIFGTCGPPGAVAGNKRGLAFVLH